MTAPQIALITYVFACMTVFAASDVLLLLFALAGLWIVFVARVGAPQAWYRNTSNNYIGICFASVFGVKLISSLWAFDPGEAVDNAFNHLHFLLWPALIPFLLRANLNPMRIEPFLAFTMALLGIWLGAEYIGVLNSQADDRFEAGVGSFGMLATVLAFFNLWLAAAATRRCQSFERGCILVFGFVCGSLVLYATKSRTELLGVLLGLAGILAVRLGNWALDESP